MSSSSNTPPRSGPSNTGWSYLLEGLRLIRQPGLRRYAAAPVLINILVYSIVIWLGTRYIGGLFDQWLPDSQSWWASTLRTLAWLLTIAVGGALVFFGFTAIGNIIGAPFNGYLSQAVERQLSGEAPPDLNYGSMLVEIPRTMLNEARKVLYFAFIGLVAFVLPLILTSVIPVINILAPIIATGLSALFLAWMNAVEYVDYPMSNRRVAFKTVRRTVGSRRWLCLGFGGAVLLMMAIPLINLIAMPAAVAGATALWHDHFRNK